MHADILSWSRSQGLFAGVAVKGATLRQDLDDNATLYGKKLENRDIVMNGVRAPEAAKRLLTILLNKDPRPKNVWTSPRSEGDDVMLILIIVLVLLFGGGGGYYYGRGAGWGGPHYGGGLLGLVPIILVVLWLTGNLAGSVR